MKYRIWCEVWGGVTGSRQAWMKDNDGNVREFDSKEEADEEAGKCNREMGKNSPARFRYTVKEARPCETDCFAQYGGSPPCEDNPKFCPYV